VKLTQWLLSFRFEAIYYWKMISLYEKVYLFILFCRTINYCLIQNIQSLVCRFVELLWLFLLLFCLQWLLFLSPLSKRFWPFLLKLILENLTKTIIPAAIVLKITILICHSLLYFFRIFIHRIYRIDDSLPIHYTCIINWSFMPFFRLNSLMIIMS